MPLKRLSVTGVRNLQPVTLHPSPRINLIHGANGSGKTSLLEAIHLLGLARSFRSTRLQPVIRYGEQACTVFGEIAQRSGVTNSVGITRSKEADYQIRMDGQKVRSLAELAAALPLQLINPDSFRLLEGAPKQRRQYLIGVCSTWNISFSRHGNACKASSSVTACSDVVEYNVHAAAWEIELVAAGEQLDAFRQAYLQQLKPVFEDILAQLVPLEDLTLSYYRGWDREKPLAQVLDEQFERDTQLGYTQAGAQRADLRLRYRGMNAVDVLSRGQQKLVVCALKIAQGYLMKQHGAQQDCVFLVDDLPSELDEHHRRALCSLLENLECQVFISCVELATLRECWKTDTPVSMFHVEHGHIVQTEDVWE